MTGEETPATTKSVAKSGDAFAKAVRDVCAELELFRDAPWETVVGKLHTFESACTAGTFNIRYRKESCLGADPDPAAEVKAPYPGIFQLTRGDGTTAVEVDGCTSMEAAEARARWKRCLEPGPGHASHPGEDAVPPPPEPQTPEVRVTLGDDDYLVRPTRNITPYQSAMLSVFLRWEDWNDADNVTDWLMEHDLLQHFEPVKD